MSDGSTPEHEFNRKFDERFERHNAANQRGFQALREGQLKLEADAQSLDAGQKRLEAGQLQLGADMKNLEANLTVGIREVRTASETAHTQILSTLDEINARLDRLENNGD